MPLRKGYEGVKTGLFIGRMKKTAFMVIRRKYKKIFTFILIFLGMSTFIQAQENKDELRLLARPMPDSILLRWAPVSYPLWFSGNKHGYMVSRTLILKDGQFTENPEPELLLEKPIKPAPLEKWEEPAENNDYAGVAAQAIYGDGFEVEAGSNRSGILQILDKATQQQSQFGFALLAADVSPQVARLSGLSFSDTNVQSGEKYLYKVWPVYQPGGAPTDTAYFYTGVDEYRPLPAPTNVMADPGDKNVTLTWEKYLQEGIYTGFWIERSLDKENGFQKLNQSLLINTTPEGHDEVNYHYYVDSLPDNTRDYFYRIIGVSPFGEKGPPSKVIKVKGVKNIRYAPRIVDEDSSPEGVRLSWEMEENENVEGFRLYRSKTFKDNYKVLADSLSVMQQSFLDKSPLPTGYYRLQAYGQDGTGPLSTPKMVQVIDSIPPAVPINLEAKVDSLGHVALKWQPNTDADILGYRVFRANEKHEEFSQLTGHTVLTNSYADSINIKTLSKKVYYKVLAVDQRQNWSGFSDILEVRRPDVVAPASPLITSVNNDPAGIAIEWNQSPSKDVMWQLIYRNKEGSRDWVLTEKLAAEASAFKDSLVTPEVLYHYLVLAVDSAGNESKPRKAVAGKMPASKLQIVKDLKASFDDKKNAVRLQWTYQRNDVVFMIYRQKNGKTVLAASTDANTFLDPFTSKEEDVYYSVVVKSNEMGRSGFSEFVKIKR